MALPFLRMSFGTILLLVSVYALMFSAGLQGGAGVATNESVTLGEAESEIRGIEAEMHDVLSENMSAAEHEFINSTIIPIVFGPGTEYAILGLEIGHQYPQQARPVGVVIPYALLAIGGAVLWRALRPVRRRLKYGG